MSKYTQISTAQDLTKTFSYADTGVLMRKLSNKRQNAEERKLDFDLNFDDLLMFGDQLRGNGKCDYTGIPFQGDHNEVFSATIERIDHKKGYVRGNIAIVGARANGLKDQFFDKTYQNVEVVCGRDEINILNQMLPRVTDDYLETLKQKYIPKFKNREELEFLMEGDYILNPPVIEQNAPEIPETLTDSMDEAIAGTQAMLRESDDQEEDREALKEKIEQCLLLPPDVEIAAQYASLSRLMFKIGVEVTLTFAQYKSIYSQKRCPFTGQELEGVRFPVLLDRSRPLEAGNMKFTSEKVGSAVNQLLDATGGTVHDLARNLKKLSS